jgi:hypothetical protein
MLTRQQLLKAAVSLARNQHAQGFHSSGHAGEALTVKEPSSDGGWEAIFLCGTTIYLCDSDVVLRALVIQALEAPR